MFEQRLGTMTVFQAELKLTKGVVPKLFHPRPVPFALKEPVEKEREIHRLEELGCHG